MLAAFPRDIVDEVSATAGTLRKQSDFKNAFLKLIKVQLPEVYDLMDVDGDVSQYCINTYKHI